MDFVKRGMGCTDTAPPEVPVWVLCRVHELMQFVAKYYGEEARLEVFKGLPGDLKCDYNYSQWTYDPDVRAS